MNDSKQKQQSPQRCSKCSNTENLTVAVTCVPDAESTWGRRVVCDNDSATTCGACGFIGKVADFEPKDSYSPENEEAWEKIARGEERYLPVRCRQTGGNPIEDETEIKRITDALLRAYPREARTTSRRRRRRTASISKASGAGRPVFWRRSGAAGRPELTEFVPHEYFR